MSKNNTYLQEGSNCALSEGWGLFQGPEGMDIERLDVPSAHVEGASDDAVFDSDVDAFHFVAKKASNGSQYHLDALRLVSEGAHTRKHATRYNHAYTVAFEVGGSYVLTGEDVTFEQMRDALQRARVERSKAFLALLFGSSASGRQGRALSEG